MATSTESEVLACVTIIRAHRQSPNPHAPPEAAVPWAIGNLRIYDPSRNAPPLRLSAVRDADVRLDVVVKGMATPLEQWRIMPGTPSDATALSLLMRSLVFHLRLGELYDVIKKRDDVEVVVSSGPALVDDSAHRLIFSCGTDSPTTVQVVINDTWRSVLLERDNKLRDPDGLGFPGDETEAASAKDHPLDDRSEDSGFSVGSFPAMPTPPMAPRMPVVGSFGTSPRVGQPSAVGSFVLPATVAQSSPAMSFAVPKNEMEDMPPLVPLSSAMTGFASPNTPNAILSLSALALDGLPRTASEPTAANAFASHGTSLTGAPFTSRQNHVPFGIGSSSCDLDDYHSSPASKEASKTPEFPATATLAFDGRTDATVDQEHRAAVTEFLGALQDFVPRVKGAPTAVSVTDAIKLVMES